MKLSNEDRAVKALEQRARRKARDVGLVAIKSRKGVGSVANFGGFRIVDPFLNLIEAGERFDLTAEDVMVYCAGE